MLFYWNHALFFVNLRRQAFTEILPLNGVIQLQKFPLSRGAKLYLLAQLMIDWIFGQAYKDVSDLAYADDIVILSSNYKKMNQ